MNKIVIFVALLTQFPQSNSTCACSPNSRVVLGNKVCRCNSEGQWDDANCPTAQRRQACRPGQVVFQGCNRCVCQENGQLSCTEDRCFNNQHQSVQETMNAILPWCSPFKTYYFRCNICECPASGKTTESNCVPDVSCRLFKEPSIRELSSNLNTCIPKVMYLFPCMHCHCSDDGLLKIDNCDATCALNVDLTQKCVPKTLYRRGCNVCLCPENGEPDNKICTKAPCADNPHLTELQVLRNKSINCVLDHFTPPRCIFCVCNSDGAIDKKKCLEVACLRSNDIKYNVLKESCSPGEMVPFCLECFCPPNGKTTDDLCTDTCSNQSRVHVLEKVVLAGIHNVHNKSIERSNSEDKKCEPNSIYFDSYYGKYCACPSSGINNFKLCQNVNNNPALKERSTTFHKKITLDFSAPCEPNTLIDFDCNTCFCSKNGRIDPKWCTFDDCSIVKDMRDLYAKHPYILGSVNKTCTPGSIFKKDCNYCICSENGLVNKSSCTGTDCKIFENDPPVSNEKLVCDPKSYFEVDCNVCLCPKEGIKNVAKCTKNHCDVGFLRTDDCSPGQLFSDGCNICICPPSGDKAHKVCTKSRCTELAPWKKIFQLSESLSDNNIVEDATRNLDLCFPGEVYVNGCKLCMCPDMGLRYYATCSPSFCEEDSPLYQTNPENNPNSNRKLLLKRRAGNEENEECQTYNATTSVRTTNSKCSPGSMYIIKCQQCICPYMGDINSFCRKLPAEFHCEKAFPGINYIPMARRNLNGTILHKHTRYGECDKDGRYRDSCFMCECERGSVIAEHCFRNQLEKCANATPSFLAN